MDITTKDLVNYPFVYLASAGRAVFTDEEAGGPAPVSFERRVYYGGRLLGRRPVGAFSPADQAGVSRIVEPVELTLDHRIFHTVFDFKKQPQIPSVGAYLRTGQSYDPGWPYDEKNQDPHYYALYDDKQRMMALICHNNHYGDGWEHEGDDESLFRQVLRADGVPDVDQYSGLHHVALTGPQSTVRRGRTSNIQ